MSPQSPASGMNDQTLRDRAARIRLACFDVDGTLTDGRLYYDDAGTETKAFHVLDGMGLRLLEDHGIRVAIITARHSAALEARVRELRLSHLFTGVGDKAACLRRLAGELGLALEDASHMGDDLPDLPAMGIAGLAAAPANAHPWVAERVHWRSQAAGGAGAVREFCDLLLEARGLRGDILARFGAK
jgi:3-deoxy-D-manno-octulosonate 8-phosphate phosphatase (KDO 8-P phosphatase)